MFFNTPNPALLDILKIGGMVTFNGGCFLRRVIVDERHFLEVGVGLATSTYRRFDLGEGELALKQAFDWLDEIAHDPDKPVHEAFQARGTQTGRFSSDKPNHGNTAKPDLYGLVREQLAGLTRYNPDVSFSREQVDNVTTMEVNANGDWLNRDDVLGVFEQPPLADAREQITEQLSHGLIDDQMVVIDLDSIERIASDPPVLYSMCKHCDHFVDGEGEDRIHLEDGHQEFDHDPEPSEHTHTLEEWEQLSPDLFKAYPDGAIGPNSVFYPHQHGKQLSLDLEGAEDIELSDGGVIEAPDDDGTVRRRDVHGNCEEVRKYGEEGWAEWYALFFKDK